MQISKPRQHNIVTKNPPTFYAETMRLVYPSCMRHVKKKKRLYTKKIKCHAGIILQNSHVTSIPNATHVSAPKPDEQETKREAVIYRT